MQISALLALGGVPEHGESGGFPRNMLPVGQRTRFSGDSPSMRWSALSDVGRSLAVQTAAKAGWSLGFMAKRYSVEPSEIDAFIVANDLPALQ